MVFSTPGFTQNVFVRARPSYTVYARTLGTETNCMVVGREESHFCGE